MKWKNEVKRMEEEQQGKQCGKEVQNQENKPWKNGELKKLEEDLPRLKESDLAMAAKFTRQKQELVVMGFTLKSRWT